MTPHLSPHPSMWDTGPVSKKEPLHVSLFSFLEHSLVKLQDTCTKIKTTMHSSFPLRVHVVCSKSQMLLQGCYKCRFYTDAKKESTWCADCYFFLLKNKGSKFLTCCGDYRAILCNSEPHMVTRCSHLLLFEVRFFLPGVPALVLKPKSRLSNREGEQRKGQRCAVK